MMVVNSQHYALNGDHAVSCRQQKQQQQHRRSKVKGQQYQPTMTSPNKHSGASAKMVNAGMPSDGTSQDAKLLRGYNGGGHRTPPKAAPRSPSCRSSPGTMMAAAYAGAKFSAAPPSPHALPKPPVSWVHCGNSLPPRMKFDGGYGSESCDPIAAAAGNSYENLIANQLKLLLNMQA